MAGLEEAPFYKPSAGPPRRPLELVPAPRATVLRRVAGWLIICVVAAGVLVWVVKRQAESRRKERLAQERANFERRRVAKQIRELVSTTGAVQEWRSSACPSDGGGMVLTSQLQQELVRADGKPVLFNGLLDDLRRDNAGFTLEVDSLPCGSAELKLDLSAGLGAGGLVTARRTSPVQYYALVVQVADVSRVEAQGGDHEDTSPEAFVVHGRCLRLLFTGLSGMELALGKRLGRPQ